jgi:ribosomal subunit interface protein
MINQINITGVHKKLTRDVELYIHKKIGGLDRFIPKNARESAKAEVKIKQSKAKDKKAYECEVIIKLPKSKLTAHKKGQQITEAIDLVEDNLKNQLKKYKNKHAGPRLHRQLISRLKKLG